MSFLRGELSLGSRYAIVHLLVATALAFGPGNSSGVVFWIAGFPLFDLFALAVRSMGIAEPSSATVQVAIGVCVWVANSYLWGHIAAFVHRRVERIRPDQPTPDRADTLGELVQRRSERKRPADSSDAPS
jgi:hypothetical protein